MSVFTDKKFIADKIREYRKIAGLTQIELAEKIGVGEKQICKIENYTNLPSLISFLKIIDALKIDIKEFGINSQNNYRPKRENLEKLIYSLSDDEIDFYIDTINYIKTSLTKLNNKKNKKNR